jgi:tRNA pseudouridine38-40 synthase
MSRLKVTLAYDGTAYAGWQVQPAAHGPTIQGVVADALTRLTGENINPVAAGRTDAGVHARGQVISFNTAANIPVERWPLALNSLLPQDIVALAAEIVTDDFHARFSACWKWYRYTIHNHSIADVFRRRYSWQVRQPLQLEAMLTAAAFLVGRHDFRSFCAAGSSAINFEREVTKIELSCEGRYIYLDFVASGFLYHMVRNMVGTLVEVGRGRLKPEAVKAILASRRREQAGPTAPPQGLCLEKVGYTNFLDL